MKITLEFDDRSDAIVALHAWEFSCCIDVVDDYLRGILKHGDVSEEVHDALQKVRDILHENKPQFEA